MKKCFLILMAIILTVTFAAPLSAQTTLVSLSINEDITPGPDYIYLTVTGTYADATTQQINSGIYWLSSNTEIAEVSSGGGLHFTGEGGPVTITVYSGSVSGRKTLNVAPWPEAIDIETTLIKSDNPYRLMLLGRLSDETTRYLGPEDKVIWSTNNPWVAWVNSQGVVTFTGENGYVSIKAVVGALSDSVNTTVTDGSDDTVWRKGIRITEEIKYSATPLELSLVSILTNDSEEEIESSAADWSSSNQEVARVSSEGVLTFTGKPGFTTIKVSYGGYHYETVVTVGRFLEALKINQSLNYTSNWDGLPLALSVTARYNDGSQIIQSTGFTWTVSNKNVAAISADGVITFTGKPGAVTISVKGTGSDETVKEDTISIVVPDEEKPVPRKLYIDVNPVYTDLALMPKAFCAYSDGSLRDVTKLAAWSSSTPDTATIFQGRLYLSPNSGPVQIKAAFLGLADTVVGYNHNLTTESRRVCQLRIKEHFIPYSYKPVNITAAAVMSDGSSVDATANVKWQSSQPFVAKVSAGKLSFTGRTGKAVVTVEGYGFRDEISVEVSPMDLQPQVEKLVITGNLTRGANQLKLDAYYNDGTVVDVTNKAVWNTGNKNIASVNTGGLVMFIGGFRPVVITAHYGGQEVKIERN